jgi:peroxiredoxin
MIKKGDTFPGVNLKRIKDGDALEDFDTAAALKGKKVVIFGVPGAFTPVCHKRHLPGYVEMADAIHDKGADEIICLSVNDPYVMEQWGQAVDRDHKVMLWADGNAELTRALDLALEQADKGLGLRCKRFMMIVDDGVVTHIDVESEPGKLDVASAETCLVQLAA